MSANVIDSLFITLGLDTSQYDKNQKSALDALRKFSAETDTRSKSIAESGNKAAQSFKTLKVEILGALAVFGVSTGLKDFIQSNITGQAALGRTAANLDMSAGRLRAWGAIAEETGGKADDAYTALSNIGKGVAEARINGSSAFTQAALKYKVQIDPKSEDQTLLNIAQRVQQIYQQTHSRQIAMAAATELQAGGMFNALIMGSASINQRLGEASKYTGSFDADDAQKLQYQIALLKLHFEDIQNKVFAKLGPVLLQLGDRFAKWLDGVDWQKVIDRIGNFIDKVKDVVKEMGGWKVIAAVLGGVLTAKLLSPLFSLIGLFTRLMPLMAGVGGGISSIAAAAGLAAAAFGGWELGKWIYSNMSDDLKDKVGSFVNLLLALGGNKNAQEQISIDEKLKAGLAANADLKDPKTIQKLSQQVQAKAKASGQPEAGPEIGSDMFGAYDPMRSRTYGNNQGLFAFLEKRYGLPPGTLAEKFRNESSNGKNLISPKGALGPMGFLLGTANQYGLNSNSVMDLDKSAEAAAKYLSDLHKQFGSWDKAEAAYNWGPGNLQKDLKAHGDQWLSHAPAETQAYVRAHQLAAPGMLPAGNSQAAAGDHSMSVTINRLEVNAPKATSARDIAQNMGEAIRGNNLIMGMNNGLA